MIYNVPPICKKPLIVFDGQDTSVFNSQFLPDCRTEMGNNKEQFVNYVQITGNNGTIGDSTSTGDLYDPTGIFIDKLVNFSGKKKLYIYASASYHNGDESGQDTENRTPATICIFKDRHNNMLHNCALSQIIPARHAFPTIDDDVNAEIIIPDPVEMIFDVSDLSGEYYIGLCIDHSNFQYNAFYYINIGEIIAF